MNDPRDERELAEDFWKQRAIERLSCECSELGRMLNIHNMACPIFKQNEEKRLAQIERNLNDLLGD